MKTRFLITILLATGAAYGQQARNPKLAEYQAVMENGTLAQKDSLVKVITGESKTYKTEEDFRLAINVLRNLDAAEQSQAVEKMAVKKFPKGSLTRDAFMENTFYKAESAEEKEKAYKELVKKWPYENFKEENMAYEYALASLAGELAKEGESEKAVHYLGQMQERFWRGNGYIPVGQTLLAVGDTTTAASLFKTAMDDGYYFLTLPEEQKDNKARFAAMGYASSMSAYVNILVNRGQYGEAINHIESAIEAAPEQADGLANVYYRSLMGVGRKLEAYNILSKLYAKGQFNVENDLKTLYADLNGSMQGYERYNATLQEQLVDNVREHIKENETFKPAPAFELENLKGEKVSLANLKGKVVVLDFWATWCQPCIRSFPGMKAAQDLYAADEDVVFLFMNTWERDPEYKTKVAAFIEKNQYPFEVLFDDQKDAETGQVLAAKMGVSGIPAKFIIDKDGNIRYALTGSSSNVDYIKIEMRELIEAAKKPVTGDKVASR